MTDYVGVARKAKRASVTKIYKEISKFAAYDVVKRQTTIAKVHRLKEELRAADEAFCNNLHTAGTEEAAIFAF